MKLPLWVMIWILAIESVFVLALIPGEWTTAVVEKESELMLSRLGREEHRHVYQTATRWYNDTWVENGFYEAVYHHLVPTPEQINASSGMQGLGNTWFTWVGERLNAISMSYYHTLMRFALLMTWAPYFLILLLPSLYDGFASWHIKRTNFDFASPVVHRYSVAILLYLSTAIIALFITPIVIEPLLVPGFMIVFCVFIGQIVGHLNKRV